MDVSGIEVSAPADWFTIGPDPATRRESALRDITARAESQPELAAYQDEIAEVLFAFGANAEELGALSCAALWEPTPSGPVVANAMVFLVEPLPGATTDDQLDAITETLAAPAESDIGPRDVDRVFLPAGSAARVRFLREAGEEGAPNLVFDQTQFWIPLSGPDRPTLVVSASTPTLHAGDRVAAAAEIMAASVEVPAS